MKTVAQILRTTKKGDVLRAGKRKWVIGDKMDGTIIGIPDNKATKFEIWSHGIEQAAVIPGLKVVKS